MTAETILLGTFVAVIYALSMYVKKTLNTANPETFDWIKMLFVCFVDRRIN